MSLSSDLKYLYTAVTRAKCNLWIYDTDEEKRLPMFDYWNRLGLVNVIQIGVGDETSLFTATSTKEQWKERGDYFKKKQLWEPAIKCYLKANENHLEMEARAYHYVQQANSPTLRPHEKQTFYLKAALAFLDCDKLVHDIKYIRLAASCLTYRRAKKSKEAGTIYTLLHKVLIPLNYIMYVCY